MSNRDTIDGKTGAESILHRCIALTENMPEAQAYHARVAVMKINHDIAKTLYKPSDTPYHVRCKNLANYWFQATQRNYIDRYEQEVYETAGQIALDFYVAVKYHEDMLAPLPF